MRDHAVPTRPGLVCVCVCIYSMCVCVSRRVCGCVCVCVHDANDDVDVVCADREKRARAVGRRTGCTRAAADATAAMDADAGGGVPRMVRAVWSDW